MQEKDESACACKGICALIWFSATYREGIVGLHRPPSFSDPARQADPELASRDYRTMIKDMTTYLEEMEVPRSAIENLTQTSPTEVVWLQADRDVLDRPPSVAEWTARICGREGPNESELLTKKYTRKYSGEQASDDRRMLEELAQKTANDRLNCASRMRDDYVAKLPVP
jgi:hypothetical protein